MDYLPSGRDPCNYIKSLGAILCTGRAGTVVDLPKAWHAMVMTSDSGPDNWYVCELQTVELSHRSCHKMSSSRPASRLTTTTDSRWMVST